VTPDQARSVFDGLTEDRAAADRISAGEIRVESDPIAPARKISANADVQFAEPDMLNICVHGSAAETSLSPIARRLSYY
jgi:hypothetical protein